MCEWGVPALLTDRGAHTAVSSSSTSRALNRAESTWAHTLSQGRRERRAAGAAVQNVTLLQSHLQPALTEQRQEEFSTTGTQPKDKKLLREACGQAIGLSSWPRRNGQQPFPEAGKAFAAAICKPWDPLSHCAPKANKSSKDWLRTKNHQRTLDQ